MIKVNKKYLPNTYSIAISGGIDSLACAHFLHKSGQKFQAIHYNHNQRPQNNLMQKACENFCADHKIKLIIGKCSIKINKNIEDGLRRERLKFFSQVGGSIIQCQHLQDAVESYISNTLKGCPEHKPIQEFTDFNSFSIYRPFILNIKKDFENWVDKNNLFEYLQIDESNEDQRYERNWIRKTIIPEIESRKGLNKVVLKKFYLNNK
jgi:tRNA(Ile)-lysidine synthase